MAAFHIQQVLGINHNRPSVTQPLIPSTHWLCPSEYINPRAHQIEDKTPGSYGGQLVVQMGGGVKNCGSEHWNWYLVFFFIILMVNKSCSHLLKLGQKNIHLGDQQYSWNKK